MNTLGITYANHMGNDHCTKIKFTIDYLSALELGFGHYISCGSGPLVITWQGLASSDNVLCLEV